MPKIPNNIKIDPTKIQKLRKISFQEGFIKNISSVRKINITINKKPMVAGFDFSAANVSEFCKVKLGEELGRYNMSASKGELASNEYLFSCYDESKYQFLSIEGIANFTSHALIYYTTFDIIPTCIITFHFYTKSENIVNRTKGITLSIDPSAEANLHYVEERTRFLVENSVENSILFIDGPMIGGNISGHTISLVKKLHEKNIIPVFFVKNSDSSLVVDNFHGVKGKYHSDMHWAYEYLEEQQRTNLFLYTDEVNTSNQKLFCYIKPLKRVTPQRIEFLPQTYSLFRDNFDMIFDLIQYLILVHGNKTNPQIRPIAIAEKYAREVIRIINPEDLLTNSSLIQTMNQSRFGG